MHIRVLGAGWYGCHLAQALLRQGHDVEVHERASRIFAGASGGNPARLHIGPHYPRSAKTRKACQEHAAQFQREYGRLTRGVPVNIYAVAEHDSLVDFDTYMHVLRGDVEFTQVQPSIYGLQNVEGAIFCNERHIVIDAARQHFEAALAGRITLNAAASLVDDPAYDLTIDCTFCANDSENIDRFEPCLTVLLQGPTDRAITIMDGPFPSLYPWQESAGLSSLTSASLTPLHKSCKSYVAAQVVLNVQDDGSLQRRAEEMISQMAHFYPEIRDLYRVADYKLSIRAQPRSGADARLCEMIKVGRNAVRIRAGKIDAVFHAEHLISDLLRESCSPSAARKAA